MWQGRRPEQACAVPARIGINAGTAQTRSGLHGSFSMRRSINALILAPLRFPAPARPSPRPRPEGVVAAAVVIRQHLVHHLRRPHGRQARAGALPWPCNWSTILWISGCWMCRGLGRSNCSTPADVSSRTGSLPNTDSVSLPSVPLISIWSSQTALAKFQEQTPRAPQAKAAVQRDHILDIVGGCEIGGRALNVLDGAEKEVEDVQRMATHVQEQPAAGLFGHEPPWEAVRGRGCAAGFSRSGASA